MRFISPTATAITAQAVWVLTLAIAALARFWRLGYHSIWFDEAVTLQWATSNPVWTWQKTIALVEDKHPPGYYLLLHGWIEVLKGLGLPRTDEALRLFGGLLGVLTVLGVMLLARRLSGRSTALLAGLLAALAPALVWYSQELRMFQPAATGLVWAGYCMIRAWVAAPAWRRWGWWIGFIVCFELAIYSYLFSAFLLPAAGLTLLLLAYRARQTERGQWAWAWRFGEGALAMIVAGALFLPLAYNAWLVNSAEGAPGVAFANLGANLWRMLRVFTLWRVDWPGWLVTTSLLGFGGLAIAGLSLPARPPSERAAATRPAPSDRGWLLIWLGVPLLIGNLLLARSDSVFAEDRYFLFLAPFLLWAVARGALMIDQRWRGAGWATGGLAVALMAASLPHLWTPAMYRENWRAAAHYIADYQQASPTLPAAVVVHIDYTRRPFERYLRPRLGAEEIPIFFPFGGALAPDQVDAVIAPPLQGIIDQGAATLWLTQSHLDGVDDHRLVERWLAERFPLVTEQHPTGIKLSGYALQSRFAAVPPLPESAQRPRAELAPGLMLAACEVLTPTLSARDDQLHPPSGWVHVRLWWQSTGPVDDDYIATAQAVGPEGVWGDRLYRENEALRRWPTSSWQVGDVARDEIDINLNPVMPDGTYPIVIGLMDSTGHALPSRADCGAVQISNTP